jgi:hypothetical protein
MSSSSNRPSLASPSQKPALVLLDSALLLLLLLLSSIRFLGCMLQHTAGSCRQRRANDSSWLPLHK